MENDPELEELKRLLSPDQLNTDGASLADALVYVNYWRGFSAFDAGGGPQN
ncbi:MAG TPA: hypothetical protein P5079_02295 [Elusimicrobiota bacterium]|nr:hypothetical protein [Elusimicrobiota bacterium]